jgi:hypothetical protein
VILLLALPVAASDQINNFSPVVRDQQTPQKQVQRDETSAKLALDGPPYWEGNLRVYVVEHVSSMNWTSGGFPYEFPFLAFAINSPISVNDTLWDTTVTWDGSIYGYNNLQDTNIAVQAVLFSQTDGFAEAAAMADPGVPGSNVVGPGYTHTVFVEEGTATW